MKDLQNSLVRFIKKRKIHITFIVSTLLVLTSAKWFKSKGDDSLSVGLGKINVNLNEKGQKKNILPVWYYRPKTWNPKKILFIIHGTNGNPKEYLKAWKQTADTSNVLLIAPQFSSRFSNKKKKRFNLGNIIDKKAGVRPKEEWLFSAIDDIFEEVTTRTGSPARTYDIFGHSAGGQFVHRMILLCPESNVRSAIAANSGWYTLPDTSTLYPYGIGNNGLSDADLSMAFSKKLTILLGSLDTNSRHWALRKTEEAELQGNNRLERGTFFYDFAHDIAVKREIVYSWEMDTVSEVGHDYRQMSAFAARLLY